MSTPLASERPTADGSGEVPQAEWERRVDVAACYRLLARYRMTDLADGFIVARVPGDPGSLLVYGYAEVPDEVTASGLYKRPLHEPPAMEKLDGPDYGSITMSQAILAARPDVECVIHAHTKAVMTFASLDAEILPMTQPGVMYHGRYGQVEGLALDFAEPPYCARLTAALGDHHVVVLRNHGVICVGATVPAAFRHLYYFDQACAVQVAALQTGAGITMPSPDEAATIQRHYWSENDGEERVDYDGTRDWPALLRLLDAADPSYRT
jgi:ribulose-5-phosphate 4-epimerase/fuculose-1-phosphate aldolase